MTAEVQHLVSRLQKVKRIWRDAFPEQQSAIPTDILLAVVYHHSLAQPLSMKELVAELPHSEAGIKQHLRRLEDEGLIRRYRCQCDGRVVRLAPADCVLDTIIQVGRGIQDLFNPPL